MKRLSTQGSQRSYRRASMARGFTLVELLVVILIIGILAAIIIPAVTTAIRRANVTACAKNLKSLHEMSLVYATLYRGSFPAGTGSDFWLALSNVNPPLIRDSLQDIHGCDVKGITPPFGETDYRGPSGNLNLYDAGDPIGADKVGNHGDDYGGNVLRNTGDVREIQMTEDLWTVVDSKTSE